MLEATLALTAGGLFAASVYLILSRNLLRVLFGILTLSNAANLSIFIAGRLTRDVPPIIPRGSYVPEIATANPLPQALILTAIVIGFSLFAFILVLVYRAYQDLGTVDGNQMREAEPDNDIPAPFLEARVPDPDVVLDAAKTNPPNPRRATV
ncbi:MAG: Na+/H+ antiporter subunit C [Pseudomonadota bacterium]